MAQRQEQFQQEAYQSMQKAQQDAMAPIYQKLDEAIQAVGKAEGVVYIFDLARTPIPFVGAQSVDVTAKVKRNWALNNRIIYDRASADSFIRAYFYTLLRNLHYLCMVHSL